MPPARAEPAGRVGTGAAPRAARAEQGTVLAIVGIGVFRCTLDSSILNVSPPAIALHTRFR